MEVSDQFHVRAALPAKGKGRTRDKKCSNIKQQNLLSLHGHLVTVFNSTQKDTAATNNTWDWADDMWMKIYQLNANIALGRTGDHVY
jgi:hypothetical protein